MREAQYPAMAERVQLLMPPSPNTTPLTPLCCIAFFVLTRGTSCIYDATYTDIFIGALSTHGRVVEVEAIMQVLPRCTFFAPFNMS